MTALRKNAKCLCFNLFCHALIMKMDLYQAEFHSDIQSWVHYQLSKSIFLLITSQWHCLFAHASSRTHEFENEGLCWVLWFSCKVISYHRNRQMKFLSHLVDMLTMLYSTSGYFVLWWHVVIQIKCYNQMLYWQV